MKLGRYILAFVAALSFVICLAVAEVLVCPRCGCENPHGALICEHCKAKLPEVITTVRPENRTDGSYSLLPSGKFEFLGPAVVEEEIRLGRLYNATGEVEVAKLYFRNAAALDMLTNPSLANDRAARIAEFLKNHDFGKGGAAWKQNAAHSTGRYEMLQQGRKYVPMGGAWIPLAIESKLSVRQIVLVRRAATLPCQSCMGSGRLDCQKCKGTGEIKCTNSKCVKGIVKVEVANGLSGTKSSGLEGRVVRSEKCKICGGRGLLTCPDCNGEKTFLCKDCNGTGAVPLCRSCGGEGFLSCKRCNGTGKEKSGVCSVCNGDGIVLCSSCNGDGRKK